MWKKVTCNGSLLAIIVSGKFQQDGTFFFTPEWFSQQLGYMHHPKGHRIKPHSHRFLSRETTLTQEVLFIRKGRLRVDFYDENDEYFKSEILEAGDVILLTSGGHGFETLEELEMFEVKQGPFVGETDKRRFDVVNADEKKNPAESD
jgi:mannose-6-phosphate isomerase-like protein (cupin superfamily)